MFLITAIAALAIWGLIATVVELRRDGYRATPTDWSRVAGVDPPERSARSAP